MIFSSVCVSMIPASAYGLQFFGNIDSHWAPCDTPPTPDAARGAELVDPRSQLMRHPLAVPRLGRGPHAAAVYIGEIHGEAGVPPPPAFGVVAGHIAHVLDGCAEAGGTHHRTVG